jgi:hypothetical protein
LYPFREQARENRSNVVFEEIVHRIKINLERRFTANSAAPPMKRTVSFNNVVIFSYAHLLVASLDVCVTSSKLAPDITNTS